MSVNWPQDLRELHHKNGFDDIVYEMDGEELGRLLLFRLSCLEEEIQELREAIVSCKEEDVIDAIIDLMVFAVGTLDLFAIDSGTAWNEVHSANMKKKRGIKKGRPNPFGFPDLMKPEGWEAPNLENHVSTRMEMMTFPKIKHTPSNVLRDCIALQKTKGSDYQCAGSGIKQADHYPRGIETITDMVWQKMIRARSILYKMREGESINHESLMDTYKDIINYSSFAVSWLLKGIDGQKPDQDVFCREKTDEQD